MPHGSGKGYRIGQFGGFGAFSDVPFRRVEVPTSPLATMSFLIVPLLSSKVFMSFWAMIILDDWRVNILYDIYPKKKIVLGQWGTTYLWEVYGKTRKFFWKMQYFWDPVILNYYICLRIIICRFEFLFLFIKINIFEW